MDAGKIKTFVPLPDFRSRDGAAGPAGSALGARVDAALVAARISLASLLDARIPSSALVNAAIPLTALAHAKIPLSALIAAGIPASALVNERLPLRALVDAKVPLRALLVGFGGERDATRPGVPPQPAPLQRDGVVVSLTGPFPFPFPFPAPGAAPGAGGRYAGAPVAEPDYGHLNPGMPFAAGRPGPGTPSLQPDSEAGVRTMLPTAGVPPAGVLAAGVLTAERNTAQPARPEAAILNAPAPGAAPDTRIDFNPLAHPLVTVLQAAGTAEPKSSALSAAAQARDLERLAGLHVRGDVPLPAAGYPFSRLILGMIALGVLLLLLF